MRHARVAATVVTASALLSGCATLPPPHEDALARVTRDCLEQNEQFIDAWGCIQSHDALEEAGRDGSRRNQFLKLGDDLASRVVTKKLSSADAKKRLAAGLPAEAAT
jgi:hypothetical protein